MNDMRPMATKQSSDRENLFVSRNYPYNCWYVAGTSEEIETGKLVSRTLLEHPVVLYRKSDGTPVALRDRCPHRWLPLSMGWLEDDNVVCGYHGFRFEPGGRCIKIPTQNAIPAKAQVRSYPVVERKPFVWIWMGEPEKADEVDLPPEFPWVYEPDWLVVRGRTDLAANYMLLRENVLDLTHFCYAHKDTFQVTDITTAADFAVVGDTVSYNQLFDTPLAPMYGNASGIGTERAVNRRKSGTFVTPALHVATIEINDPSPPPGARSTFLQRIVHATTPVSPTRTTYWWLGGRDHGIGLMPHDKLQALVEEAFNEDKVILEAIQRTIMTDPEHLTATEVSVAADRGGFQARRIVNALLAREGRQA